MYRIVKLGLAGIVLASACASAMAGARTLPEVGLVDERGLTISRSVLEQNRHWVLVVVDASRPLTRTILAMLEKNEGGWDDAVTVVVIGDDAALAQLGELQQRLSGVRWYRSTELRLTALLKVPGVPTVLGIDATQQVVWQVPGVRGTAEELQARLSEWLTVLQAPQ